MDGVTKIGKITFRTSEERQAENFRKMLLAMARDIRVILVKLADRLHNMRTLNFQPEARQRKIAQETLEIYAPLANRMGISWIKSELEDLAFRYLQPEIYNDLVDKVVKKKNEREKYIEEVKQPDPPSCKSTTSRGRSPGAPSTSTRSTSRCSGRGSISIRSTT